MKLHIDRLELDLHGDIAAHTAQEAAALLGPALAEALRGGMPAPTGAAPLQVAAQPDAAALARQLAGHLAPQIASHLAARHAAQPPDSKRRT
jgi:hypothetical protein